MSEYHSRSLFPISTVRCPLSLLPCLLFQGTGRRTLHVFLPENPHHDQTQKATHHCRCESRTHALLAAWWWLGPRSPNMTTCWVCCPWNPSCDHRGITLISGSSMKISKTEKFRHWNSFVFDNQSQGLQHPTQLFQLWMLHKPQQLEVRRMRRATNEL